IRPKVKKPDGEFDRLLAVFELGVCFRAVRLSGNRIETIVTSPRNYGRQGSAEWEEVDLVSGIRDTLTVLNNRLKDYELSLDLGKLPLFSCQLGEINQVWTNILVNAADATPKGGRIEVSATVDQGQ